MSYPIPKKSTEIEIEIKNSRFIGYAEPTSSIAQAQAVIAARKALHPKANHNCWAFLAGAPNTYENRGCSDDGEPKGTAGQPMLKVLDHSGIGHLCVVVTRYFGGIKLGTGGLVRAYSQCTSQTIEALTLVQFIPQASLRLSFPYPLTGQAELLITQVAGTVTTREWSEKAIFSVEMPTHKVNEFKASLEPWPQISLLNGAHQT
ncbi:MAG: YigZ family protein, partial [Pontibacterium sp.]